MSKHMGFIKISLYFTTYFVFLIIFTLVHDTNYILDYSKEKLQTTTSTSDFLKWTEQDFQTFTILPKICKP